MEEKVGGMFASMFENGVNRRPTNLESVLGSSDHNSLLKQDTIREPTKSIYMPTNVNKKEIEKIFEKQDKSKVKKSQEKIQEWINKFMSEVERINTFYETKQVELIQEFQDL